MVTNERASSAVLDQEQVNTGNETYTVTFIESGGETTTIRYRPGVTPYQEHGREGSLLDIALNYGVPLDHACGGNCACTTCHIIVKEGEENLSSMEEDEEDRLYYADGLTLHSRLGCQAVVKGNVTVEIPD